MCRLIKYELRKSRAAFGILALTILVLEAYYLFSINADSEGNIVMSCVLLAVSGFATAITIFVLGITTYSNELKQKTSYLIFMTPNSALSVIAAKLLYTIMTTLVFSALLGGFCMMDVRMLLEHYDELTDFYRTIDEMLSQMGIKLNEFYLVVAFNAGSVFLSLISALVTAYLAVTFSATVMQNRRGRGWVTFLVYVLILFGLNRISALYTDPDMTYSTVDALTRALIPSAIQSLAVIALCLFGSAWMLESKVSL